MKIDEELLERLRKLVFIKYDGMIYGNLLTEANKAIQKHCELLQSEITPEMLKKYNLPVEMAKKR